MGLNLKNTLNTKLKQNSVRSMPKQTSNIVRSITDKDGTFDVNIQKFDVSPDTITGTKKLLGEAKDKFNIKNQSIIGNETDGETFAGFVKSVGNDEDGNGFVEFVGGAGIEGATAVVAYSSGAPEAISLATKDLEEKTNIKKAAVGTFLDSLPVVLGKPSGGFLSKVLAVVGASAALSSVLGAVSPLAGITEKLSNIKDQFLESTGIGGLINKVNGVIDNATKMLGDITSNITANLGSIVQQSLGGVSGDLATHVSTLATDLVSSELQDLTEPLTNKIRSVSNTALEIRNTPSLGGLIQNMTEDITQNLSNRVNALVPGMGGIVVASVISGIAAGGEQKVNAIKTVILEDGAVKTLGDKVTPVEPIAEAKTVSEAVKVIVKNAEENGATAAEIANVKNAAEKIEKELNDNNFNPKIAGLLAVEASSPQGAPFVLDLSKKFTYVSSVEELELEFSSKLLSESSRSINTVVLHASETFSNKNIGAEEIEAIVSKTGDPEDEIPYHYVIRRDGRLQRGKPVEEEGNHCAKSSNVNPTSIGVVMVGGINRASTEQPWETSSSSFTRAQFDTLEQFLSTYYFHFPSGEVLGHSDVEEEELDPYFDVQEYILSLFGKINQSQVEFEETEKFEDLSSLQGAPLVLGELDSSDRESLLVIARLAIEKGLPNFKTTNELFRSMPANSLNSGSLDDKKNALRKHIADIEAGRVPAPTPSGVSASTFEEEGFLDFANNEGEYTLVGMPQTDGYAANTMTQAEEDAIQEKYGALAGPNPNLHKRVVIEELKSDLTKKLLNICAKMETNLRVNSGYRNPIVNKNVGGHKNSKHMQRIASDIGTRGFSEEKIATLIQHAIDEGFKSIGTYNTFVHLDITSRNYVKCWFSPNDENTPIVKKFAVEVMLKNKVTVPAYARA